MSESLSAAGREVCDSAAGSLGSTPDRSRKRSRIRASAPLLLILGVELCFVTWLITARRGVVGHDAFQYFSLQYFFLSNSVASGETAQWLPLLTHGTVSNWWYGVQAGILQTALLALGREAAFLRGVNFLPIYYIGIFFDILVLTLGVWALGRRYYASRWTGLFVALAAVGSSDWFTQPWYNLHLVFALPLILHLLHRLLDTGRWRYLFLAGNLFVVQSIGTLPYILPLSAFVITAYFLIHAVATWAAVKPQLALLIERWRFAIVPFVLVALAFACAWGTLTLGTDEIANYNIGRNPDGRSESVESFLTYGTNSNARWREMWIRVSPALDYNLYIGYPALAFACLALTVRLRRAGIVIAATAVLVLLVANATFVAEALYHVWPAMKFYRHLTLASPIVRLFICLLAGFGLEALLRGQGTGGAVLVRVRFAVMSIAFAVLACALGWLAFHPQTASMAIRSSAVGTLPMDEAALVPEYVANETFKATLLAAAAAALFTMLARRSDASPFALSLIVAFQAVDIYSFRYGLATSRTIELNEEQEALARLQPLPYTARRLPVDYDLHPRGRHVPQNRYGAVYWTADLYTFTDPPANLGRTDHWLRPLDDFLRAYWGEPLRDRTRRPQFFQVYGSLRFPLHQPTALKLAGVTEDKIQFFRHAHELPTDEDVASRLAAPGFRGDVLYIAAAKLARASGRSGGPRDLTERVRRQYEILRYDANHIAIRVSNAGAGEWLYYADAWHRSWRAAVNGVAVPVARANLAYKAVPLAAGENVVHFTFDEPLLRACMTALNWNGLLWMALTAAFLVRCVTRGDTDPRAGGTMP